MDVILKQKCFISCTLFQTIIDWCVCVCVRTQACMLVQVCVWDKVYVGSLGE